MSVETARAVLAELRAFAQSFTGLEEHHHVQHALRVEIPDQLNRAIKLLDSKVELSFGTCDGCQETLCDLRRCEDCGAEICSSCNTSGKLEPICVNCAHHLGEDDDCNWLCPRRLSSSR